MADLRLSRRDGTGGAAGLSSRPRFLRCWSCWAEGRVPAGCCSLLAAQTAKLSNRWRAAFEAAPSRWPRSAGGPSGGSEPRLLCPPREPERAVVGRRLSALVYPDDLSELAGPGDRERPRWPKSRCALCAPVAACAVRTGLLAGARRRRATSTRAGVVVDITRHKRSQAALRDLATRDPLSGLANRRWFELQLARHLRTCATDGQGVPSWSWTSTTSSGSTTRWGTKPATGS